MGDITIINVASKTSQNEVNQHLYNMLKLLNSFYTPSAKFCSVLKEDMFTKSNKNAFFEVTYYLLKILNPEALKSKISVWPIYDSASEKTCRTDMMKYLNELNGIYEHANLPNVLYSNLIAPGGLKFSKYMFQLTQFVLFEHLRKSKPSQILYPNQTKNRKCTTIAIQNLKLQTNLMHNDIQQSLNGLHSEEIAALSKAEELSRKQTELNEQIKLLKCKLESRTNLAKVSEQNINSIHEERMKMLQLKLNDLTQYWQTLDGCSEFISHLKKGATVLQSNEHSASNNLNLLACLGSLLTTLKRLNLELPNFTQMELSKRTDHLQHVESLFQDYQSKLTYLSNELQQLSH